ncbi:MAG: hypothetical protein ACYSUK_03265 [Planctomycetota bacterium]|jgi:hypothetical protein
MKTKSKKNIRPGWSDKEVKLLKKLFPKGRSREVVKLTGRPLTAVRQKAYSLGLTNEHYHIWQEKELRLLKKLYLKDGAKGVAAKLGRPVDSVWAKASKLGLKKYTLKT